MNDVKSEKLILFYMKFYYTFIINKRMKIC